VLLSHPPPACLSARCSWGQYLVGLGATLGIVTGVLVNIMGVSRIVCSLARTHLFFPIFGVSADGADLCVLSGCSRVLTVESWLCCRCKRSGAVLTVCPPPHPRQEINGKTGTPIYATLFVMVATLPLAILTDLPPLIDMVSAVRWWRSWGGGLHSCHVWLCCVACTRLKQLIPPHTHTGHADGVWGRVHRAHLEASLRP
jgi:hypothetical protein